VSAVLLTNNGERVVDEIVGERDWWAARAGDPQGTTAGIRVASPSRPRLFRGGWAQRRAVSIHAGGTDKL